MKRSLLAILALPLLLVGSTNNPSTNAVDSIQLTNTIEWTTKEVLSEATTFTIYNDFAQPLLLIQTKDASGDFYNPTNVTITFYSEPIVKAITNGSEVEWQVTFKP